MPLAEVIDRNIVPAATYEGVVVSVEKDIIVPKTGKQAGQNVPILRWVFDIGGEENVESITGRDPSSEKSNLFKYFVALLGSDRNAWLTAEMSDLVGRKALVTVGINDDGWNRIDGVTAMPIARAGSVPLATGPVPVAAPAQQGTFDGAPAATPLADDGLDGDLPF
jgi:hypothetical protein